jgi:hypothetical protein
MHINKQAKFQIGESSTMKFQIIGYVYIQERHTRQTSKVPNWRKLNNEVPNWRKLNNEVPNYRLCIYTRKTYKTNKQSSKIGESSTICGA